MTKRLFFQYDIQYTTIAITCPCGKRHNVEGDGVVIQCTCGRVATIWLNVDITEGDHLESSPF